MKCERCDKAKARFTVTWAFVEAPKKEHGHPKISVSTYLLCLPCRHNRETVYTQNHKPGSLETLAWRKL